MSQQQINNNTVENASLAEQGKLHGTYTYGGTDVTMQNNVESASPAASNEEPQRGCLDSCFMGVLAVAAVTTGVIFIGTIIVQGVNHFRV